MSDFFNGVGTGLVGAGGNGIAGAIQKMAMLPYLTKQAEQKARSQAALAAYHGAKASDIQYGLDRRNEMLQKSKIDPADVVAKILAYSKFSDSNNVANAMLTGTKADAYNRIVNPETGADGKPVDTTDLLGRFNRASLALKGTEFANGRDPGMVLDPLHGNLIVGNKELHNADIGQRRADIGQKNASAYNSMQQGRNAGSGWQQVIDTDNGYDVVDKRTGNSRTVTNNGVAVKAAQKKGGRASGRQGRSEASGAQSSDSGFTYDEARAVAAQQVKAGAIPWNKADNILRNSFGKGFDK